MSGSRIIAVGAPPTFRQQVARALAVDGEAVEWTPTVAAAESALTDRRVSPNVLVLSPAIKEPDAFGLAEFVGRSSPASAVVIVRDRAPNGLLPLAMRSGVRDVVDLSRGGEELREALRRAMAWSENILSIGADASPDGQGRGTVISVFSSKGGTGKTFLTCNVAAAIATQSTQDTAILDLELGLGDAFLYYGKSPSRPLADLLSIGDLQDREGILELGTKVHDHVWAYGAAVDPAAEPVSGEAIGKVIRALRARFSHVVIDGTAQYSDPVLAAFDLSDAICLIAGLDVVSVRHLSLALQTLVSLGFPRERFRIVLNRADSKVGLSPEEVERVTKIHVDTMIPSSSLVPSSLNLGRPIVIGEPKSEVSKAVSAFAKTFVSAEPVARRRLFRRAR